MNAISQPYLQVIVGVFETGRRSGFSGVMHCGSVTSGYALRKWRSNTIGLPPVLALGSDELKRRVAPAVLAGEEIMLDLAGQQLFGGR